MSLAVHNSTWPGMVGKGYDDGQEPPIALNRMIGFTERAVVENEKFDGVDILLGSPHFNIDANNDDVRRLADRVAERGLNVGSLVAPVWPGEDGVGSAMGNDVSQKRFLDVIRKTCNVGKILREYGVRQYGVIRIDSAEHGIAKWMKDPKSGTERIIDTFRKAADIAGEFSERLAAEGEICWAGMHNWKAMLDLLERIHGNSNPSPALMCQPGVVGFQADLAHTFLYLLGHNSPDCALLEEPYTFTGFYAAYEEMTNKLRPWTIDFHVAQNDGEVFGSGTHDKTGKHCLPNDPNGKLDIMKCAEYWLKGAEERGINHICWDGCMFSNEVMTTSKTWNDVLETMISVRDGCSSK